MTNAQLREWAEWFESRPHQALIAVAVVGLTSAWFARWWLVENAPPALWAAAKWSVIHAARAARTTCKSGFRAVKAVKHHYLSPTPPEVPDYDGENLGNTGPAVNSPELQPASQTYAAPHSAAPRRGRPPTEARPPVNVRCQCGHQWQTVARSGSFVWCPAKCGAKASRVPMRPVPAAPVVS